MTNDSFSKTRDSLFPQNKEESEPFLGDDSSFSFRVNKDLKKEFAQLCKKERLSVAAILKRYMVQCIKNDEIIL